MRQTNVTFEGNADSKNRQQAIVACTDAEIRQILTSVLREFAIQPVFLENLDEVRDLLAQQEPLIVFIQTRIVQGDFREVLRAADCPGSGIPVIVCSEFYDKDIYIEAMALGAFDYLATPYRREEVVWVVNNAVGWGSLPPNVHAA